MEGGGVHHAALWGTRGSPEQEGRYQRRRKRRRVGMHTQEGVYRTCETRRRRTMRGAGITRRSRGTMGRMRGSMRGRKKRGSKEEGK